MNASADTGIGARVRAARGRVGWTREALAFHSGISWSGITQVESGRRTNLRPRTLLALADALGVTIEYLVTGAPAGGPMLEHQGLLYGSDDDFLSTAGPFLTGGVERSEAVLAVTTSANIALLRELLGRDSQRVDFVKAEEWYTEPAATLKAYQAYSRKKLEAGAPWVRVVGEPVWAGRSDSETRMWTRYESLLNVAFAAWPASFLCPYDERSVEPEIAKQACLTHPEMIANGEIAGTRDYADPEEFVLGTGS
jgi:transcriptional regulator with XRE-family HTH domain